MKIILNIFDQKKILKQKKSFSETIPEDEILQDIYEKWYLMSFIRKQNN